MSSWNVLEGAADGDTLTLLVSTADVLSEEAILKWYSDNQLSKGKSVFLEQMKTFVEWLKNAEEGKRGRRRLSSTAPFTIRGSLTVLLCLQSLSPRRRRRTESSGRMSVFYELEGQRSPSPIFFSIPSPSPHHSTFILALAKGSVLIPLILVSRPSVETLFWYCCHGDVCGSDAKHSM